MGLPELNEASAKSNKLLQLVLLGLQVVALAVFSFCDVSYAKNAEDFHTSNSYGPFQDVHVMIFIGFGFLMTFLKDYNWSSVGFNFLLGAVAIEVSLIVQTILHGKLEINIVQMFNAEFAAGAVLISMGAVLGKANHLQLVTMAIFEIVFYKVNEYIIVDKFPEWGLENFTDIGGSMIIHAFGAYFGLAVSKIIHQDRFGGDTKEGSDYKTDLFAMIGTVFLWMYWPSFNSIPADDHVVREIVCVNTYIALAAACITTFAMSGLSDRGSKLDMVHIQNATLAGGVAMGSSANMEVGVAGAIFIGTIAGIISTAGYQYLLDVVYEKLKIHDTCGVHNLHGMPGILGCVFSIVFGCLKDAPDFEYKTQLAALFMTLGMAIVSGLFTGLIVKLVCSETENRGKELFEDKEHWTCEKED